MAKKYTYIEEIPENSTKAYSPWIPISDSKDLKCLGKLGEELGELSQVVSRCIIQGINEKNPDTEIPNRIWLEREIADVLANIDLTIEKFNLRVDKINDRVFDKRTRIKNWLENM